MFSRLGVPENPEWNLPQGKTLKEKQDDQKKIEKKLEIIFFVKFFLSSEEILARGIFRRLSKTNVSEVLVMPKV